MPRLFALSILLVLTLVACQPGGSSSVPDVSGEWTSTKVESTFCGETRDDTDRFPAAYTLTIDQVDEKLSGTYAMTDDDTGETHSASIEAELSEDGTFVGTMTDNSAEETTIDTSGSIEDGKLTLSFTSPEEANCEDGTMSDIVVTTTFTK